MKFRLIIFNVVLLLGLNIPLNAWGLINRNHIFTESKHQQLPTPSKDTAVIVFILPYELDKDVGRTLIPFMGSPMGKNTCLVYDVTSGTPKLAGAIKANTKFAYVVPPGKYLFQSIGLLAADVVGGKTYYILIEEPLIARFAGTMYPVRNGGVGEWQYSTDSFKYAVEKAVLVETTPKAYKEFEKSSKIKSINGALKAYLKEWHAYSNEQRQKLTVNPEDGISTGHDASQKTEMIERDGTVSNSPSYSKELEALEALRDDGIFTEEEFQTQKAKLQEKN